jgi:hypothetical protein
MLVYRVAHPNIITKSSGSAAGPYAARTQLDLDKGVRRELDEMAWRHTNDEHPNPTADGIVIIDGNLCGFASVTLLRTWFRGSLDLLDRGHFRVFVYDVPKRGVQYGHIQLMFDPAAAILRGSWGIWSKVPAMRARWSRCPS